MMDISILLLILVPLITAFLIPLIDLINSRLRRFLVGSAGLVEIIISISIITANLSRIKDGTFFLSYSLGGWAPALGINLALDSLGLFFSTLVSLALFLIIAYSIGYIGHHEGKYYVLLFLVLGAMQGAVITGDIFNLYVFIELLTVTSAPLVAFKRNRNSTEAAIKYMFYGITGGVFFFIGIILIYFNLGTLNMAEIAANYQQINLNMQLLILAFFLTSLLIKLGIFPFHYWLPKAHSACPGPISALLSGVLLKVYLYIFLRLFWVVFDFGILVEVGLADFLVYLGLFSSLLGHIFALQEDNIKRMLAFSTIGHIGMIVGVLALNTKAGLYGGLLHVISHLLMKSALFTGTAYLLKFTPSHIIKDFDGSAYQNNSVFVSFIIAALGMIGIPPLIGFISKWYILLAFMEEGNYAGAALVIIGSLTAVIYYLRYIAHGYEITEQEKDVQESNPLGSFYRNKVVTTVVYLFTGLVVISGIMFKLFDLPLQAAIEVLLNPQKYIQFVLGG